MRKQPNTQLLKAFSAELKSRRDLLSISQEELAHRAGLNRTFVGKLETAASQPSLTVLFQLADALEIDTSEFIQQISRRAANERQATQIVVKSPSSPGKPGKAKSF